MPRLGVARAARADAVRALRLFGFTRPVARASRRRYDEFRAEIPAPLPTSAAIAAAQGSWGAALTAAGLDPDDRRRGELLGGLIATAALSADGTATVPGYQALAERHHLPSYRTIYRAFGSWAAAVHAAGLAPGPA